MTMSHQVTTEPEANAAAVGELCAAVTDELSRGRSAGEVVADLVAAGWTRPQAQEFLLRLGDALSRSAAEPAGVSAASKRPARIDPKELMKNLNVERLCETADEYYRKISDHTHNMAKPFGGLIDSPDMLCRLGWLLAGMRLGKTMTVLEFGAGVCWLSRFLNQLQCRTISVDCSRTALEVGRKLFAEHPIVGTPPAAPEFVHFDGHSINVPDESVDRVICFDAFHHVPNQEEVLRELCRVLKPGGIAGFAEPGLYHSQAPLSQQEMMNFNVLENDILLHDIKPIAERAGFTQVYCKVVSPVGMDLSFGEYAQMIGGDVPRRVTDQLVLMMRSCTIFFLTKGDPLADSRGCWGLGHQIRLPVSACSTAVGKPVSLEVLVRNTGRAKWLHENLGGAGVVYMGVQLYDGSLSLKDMGFARFPFDRDIMPGETISRNVTFTLNEPGEFALSFDLVSARVCWFKTCGSEPQYLRVTVVE